MMCEPADSEWIFSEFDETIRTCWCNFNNNGPLQADVAARNVYRRNTQWGLEFFSIPLLMKFYLYWNFSISVFCSTWLFLFPCNVILRIDSRNNNPQIIFIRISHSIEDIYELLHRLNISKDAIFCFIRWIKRVFERNMDRISFLHNSSRRDHYRIYDATQ